MGGPSTATTTSSTAPPGYVQDAQKGLLSTGTSMLDNFLNNPNFTVAGFNPDQTQAFKYAEDNAVSAFDPSAGAATLANPTTATGAGNVTAAQVSPGDIGQFMNPYEQNVIDPTLKNMRDQYDATNSSIGARAAAGGAYGGSREAIERSQLDKNFGTQVAQTVSTLMSQGYSQAQAVAMANAQMKQQASLQNGSTDVSNAQMTNSVALANAAASNAQKNTAANNKLTALQGLLTTGNQQQALTQQDVNAPMTSLQQLMSLISGVTAGAGTNSTSTQPVQDNTLGTLLGGGLTLAKLLFPACDRRLKTDIEPLGVDEETGLQLYAFRYANDPKSYPKVIGPMADEVEERFPGATRMIGGFRVIDVEAITRMAKAA